MDKSLKRVLAFILDMLIVTVVVSAITTWTNIDFYKEKYEETYSEYMELVDELEGNEDAVSIFEDRIIELNYDVYKYQVINSAISIAVIILYFVVLQQYLNGQTIGKKILNLQVVSNDDGKKVSAFNYFIRVLILNNVIFTLLSMIAVYIIKGKEFYYFIYILSLLQSVVYMANVLMVIFRRDGRGIHDMLAGTKVIDLKAVDVEEDSIPVKKEEIIEDAVVVEKKETPKKKSTTKKATTAKKSTSKKTTTTKKSTEKKN